MLSKEDKCAVARTHLSMGKEALAIAQKYGESTRKAERIIKQAQEDIEKWCSSNKN